MKAFRKLQRLAVAGGIIYGLWLGNTTEATNGDIYTSFVIVFLSVVIALSMANEKNTKEAN